MEAELISTLLPHAGYPTIIAVIVYLWKRAERENKEEKERLEKRFDAIDKKLDDMRDDSKKRAADLHSKIDANAKESTDQHHALAERMVAVETKVEERK